MNSSATRKTTTAVDFDIAAELAGLAGGLDLHDADDRAAFRLRVAAAFANAKLSALREYARDLAHRDVRLGSQGAAVRCLADGFIAARRGGS